MVFTETETTSTWRFNLETRHFYYVTRKDFVWHIFRFAQVLYLSFDSPNMALKTKLNTTLKIFSLECDIKSFLIQIYTWKKRMVRKNNNKNKYKVLLGQWFPLRHIILQSSSSVVWHLYVINQSNYFIHLREKFKR